MSLINLKKTLPLAIVSGLFIVGAGTMASAPALAGKHCKAVYITASNHSGNPIKIIDLDYYDPAYRKWRSEPTRNEIIRHGQVWQETRRLEKVNAKLTKVRIQYRKAAKKGPFKWSTKVYNAYSNSSTCGKGSAFRVRIS